LQQPVCFTSQQENLLKQLKDAKSKQQAASIIAELLNARLISGLCPPNMNDC